MSGGWGGSYGSWGMDVSASCGDAITTTFEWQPNYPGEPPPDNVVVADTCTASWSGTADFGQPPTGAADNGLGSPEEPISGGPGGISSGTRYRILSGAQEIEVSASPSAWISSPGGTISVSVLYQANLTPVVCDLGGTTLNPADNTLNILIGQGCQAGLSAGGYTLSNYVWEIGGDTFKSYVAHGAASGGTAQVTLLAASDLEQPSPLWYWRSENGAGSDPEVVTGMADVYAGSTFVGRTSAHQNVIVWAPYYFCGYNARNVTVDINQTGGVRIGAGDWINNGIEWTGRAVPPDLFQSAGQGIWSFVQTVLSHRSRTDGGTVMCSPNNDLPGLDTSYPYDPDGGVMEADDSNAGWPDDDSPHVSGDAPCTQNVADSVSNINYSEQYWTYMMYRPPDSGYGCQWVPLHRIAWQWGVNINRPGASWLNWPGPFPSVVGTVTVSGDSRWMVHPVWSRVLIATAPFVPCQ